MKGGVSAEGTLLCLWVLLLVRQNVRGRSRLGKAGMAGARSPVRRCTTGRRIFQLPGWCPADLWVADDAASGRWAQCGTWESVDPL